MTIARTLGLDQSVRAQERKLAWRARDRKLLPDVAARGLSQLIAIPRIVALAIAHTSVDRLRNHAEPRSPIVTCDTLPWDKVGRHEGGAANQEPARRFRVVFCDFLERRIVMFTGEREFPAVPTQHPGVAFANAGHLPNEDVTEDAATFTLGNQRFDLLRAEGDHQRSRSRDRRGRRGGQDCDRIQGIDGGNHEGRRTSRERAPKDHVVMGKVCGPPATNQCCDEEEPSNEARRKARSALCMLASCGVAHGALEGCWGASRAQRKPICNIGKPSEPQRSDTRANSPRAALHALSPQRSCIGTFQASGP